MTAPSYDSALVEAELRARAAYAEPQRHYHDGRHVDECLRQLELTDGVSERERRLLRWAILWHDSVYAPGRSDNEERSAELARSELTACGISGAEAAEVARLIRLTEGHRCDAGDRLGALLVSIDLSILGAEPRRYREYAADVRKEYGEVPDALWRSGRATVLRRLLDAEPLYPDPRFETELGARARRNMDAELRTLDEG